MLKLKIKILIILIFILNFEIAFSENLMDRWNYYKKTFISQDGRVIDFQNNSITHSEGQGYGMLLSVLFDDRETFEKLWKWTKFNLQVRKGDNLFSWSWGLHPSGKWIVLDYNNATDGDTIVAYALSLATKKWSNQVYMDEAKKIIKDIRELLILKKENFFYLLPGYFGFYKNASVVLNPSYYILPAYKIFSEIDDKVFWSNFYKASAEFIENLNFGYYKLPSDWVVAENGKYSIYTEKSSNFGYDALRIPLYAIMAEDLSLMKKFQSYVDLIEKINYIPKEIDIVGNKISVKNGLACHYIIASILSKKIGKEALAKTLMERGIKKLDEEKNNYYSYTLSLISLKVTTE